MYWSVAYAQSPYLPFSSVKSAETPAMQYTAPARTSLPAASAPPPPPPLRRRCGPPSLRASPFRAVALSSPYPYPYPLSPTACVVAVVLLERRKRPALKGFPTCQRTRFSPCLHFGYSAEDLGARLQTSLKGRSPLESHHIVISCYLSQTTAVMKLLTIW
jgi:hypothetical protein